MKSASHQSTTNPLTRVLLAVFAGVFLVVGFVLGNTQYLDMASREFVSGTLLKVGVVLGLAWLAAPQLDRFGWHRLRGTMLVAVILVVILWAIRPRIGAIAAALLTASTVAFSVMGWLRRLPDPPPRNRK